MGEGDTGAPRSGGMAASYDPPFSAWSEINSSNGHYEKASVNVWCSDEMSKDAGGEKN